MAILPEVDLRQLTALRSALTDRIKDVTATLAGRVNTELGLAAIGVQTTGEAAEKIADILKRGGRGRALTIVRTELGRAYSVAGQQRFDQAHEVLPGLQKQWRRSGKIHSRASHDRADGQVRPVDQPFDDRVHRGICLERECRGGGEIFAHLPQKTVRVRIDVSLRLLSQHS